MKEPIFSGSSAAIVTPFKNGKIDYNALERIIEMQKIAGTAALTVCGTTGEASTLTEQERVDVLKFCVQRAGGMKIIAGAGSNSTAAALKNALMAQDTGADALLIVTPYYNKTTQAGLIKHFEYIDAQVSLPIILYNVPGRTGVGFKPDTYRALSELPNINGVKEASGDFGLFISTLELCGDNLNVWSGNDDVTVPMMAMGAKGVISVAANVVPGRVAYMTELCLAGRFEEASREQVRLNGFIGALFSEVNPIPVKAAMCRMGLCENELRLPLVPMSPKAEEVLEARMKELDLL